MTTETATLTGGYDCFTISQGCCHSLHGGVWASAVLEQFHCFIWTCMPLMRRVITHCNTISDCVELQYYNFKILNLTLGGSNVIVTFSHVLV